MEKDFVEKVKNLSDENLIEILKIKLKHFEDGKEIIKRYVDIAANLRKEIEEINIEIAQRINKIKK